MQRSLADSVKFAVLNLIAHTAGIVAIAVAWLIGAVVRPVSRVI